jgi:hypothetical protein
VFTAVSHDLHFIGFGQGHFLFLSVFRYYVCE